MVLLSTFLRYWQESKSNKAAESLKAMVTNTAMVLRREINYSDLSLLQQRYGAKVKQLKEIQFEIPIQYLVPGDIICFLREI
jgi:Mg2+-importing ATPase